MGKYVGIILLAVLFGCLEEPLQEVEQIIEEEGKVVFDVTAPANFNWSSVNALNIAVFFKYNEKMTTVLDNSVVEVYDEDSTLLDALTIYEGMAEFNLRLAASSDTLQFVSLATGLSISVATNVNAVEFNIANVSTIKFSKVDSDGDGLVDVFDQDSKDPNVAIKVQQTNSNALKSANKDEKSNAVYTIFEDLWPSKGDYDFNDLVISTEFDWVRGKSNYIEEINGECEIEWIGAGMQLGLGFELFEVKGTNLYYLGEVFTDVSGAERDATVRNGIVVVDNVHNDGLSTIQFSIKIKEQEFKDFICIPYLFRTKDQSHQVRPFGAPPTQAQDMASFNSKDDMSPSSWDWSVGSNFKYPLTGQDAFYRTPDNLPWGIEFISKQKFTPSKETKTILDAYPKFKTWAESGGTKEKEWYDNAE